MGLGCSMEVSKRIKMKTHNESLYPPDGHVLFKVVGAGFLAISENIGHLCGDADGCSIQPSWSKYGYSGGVMDRKEMERLRDHLTVILKHGK